MAKFKVKFSNYSAVEVIEADSFFLHQNGGVVFQKRTGTNSEFGAEYCSVAFFRDIESIKEITGA